LSYNIKEEAIKRSIELRKIYGAPAVERCEVEFFFYADEIDNALDLMNTLKKMNYHVECVQRDNSEERILITGNTPSMNMQTKDLLRWTNQMDDLAVEFDCIFDGWGALV
jgi:5-bromo-4-chloroindolyl phosphate hydrolysis protein